MISQGHLPSDCIRLHHGPSSRLISKYKTALFFSAEPVFNYCLLMNYKSGFLVSQCWKSLKSHHVPPNWVAFSSTTKSIPASFNFLAASRPDMPAPITTTFHFSPSKMSNFFLSQPKKVSSFDSGLLLHSWRSKCNIQQI